VAERVGRTYGKLERVLPGHDKGLFVVNPYNCGCLAYVFDSKTMNVPIDWNTKRFLASSNDECFSAPITINNPDSNGGIFITDKPSVDAILWRLNYECTQSESQNCKHDTIP
jgi:hypothetical protein